MILILIALIAVTAMAVYCAQKDVWISFFHQLICPMVAGIGFICLFIYCFVCYSYVAADYKKDIINREYKTNYTREEVFYASDVIETVRELNRTRVEVNGDLLKDK